MKHTISVWVEIVGAIAIVVSLSFVAIELRQNNEFLKSDTEHRLMQQQMLFQTSLLEDRELHVIYQKANKGESLTDFERDRLALLYRRLFGQLAWEWKQYQKGLIEPIPMAEAMRRVILSNDVAAFAWRSMEPDLKMVNPEFHEFAASNGLFDLEVGATTR